jgi:hypothetical protein
MVWYYLGVGKNDVKKMEVVMYTEFSITKSTGINIR